MINIFQYQMLGLNSKDLQNEYVSSSFCISSETEHDTPSGILSELQNSLHLHQKATLLHEIENLKQQHIRQIQSLKLSQHLLESTHSFNMQQMMIKYDETIYERDCLKTQNKQLRDQITKINNELNKHKSIVGKYEQKIKNQQGLIDQYKRSIEEQIGLQKQVIRVEYMERQLANKIQFQKALRCMQQNYQRKVEQQKYQSTYKEYKVDMNSMKKLCSTLTRKSKTSTNNSGQKQKQNRMDVYDTKCHNGARLSQVNPRQMKNSSSYSTIEK